MMSVTCTERPEGSRETNRAAIRVRNILGREDGTCKGPEVEEDLTEFQNVRLEQNVQGATWQEMTLKKHLDVGWVFEPLGISQNAVQPTGGAPFGVNHICQNLCHLSHVDFLSH